MRWRHVRDTRPLNTTLGLATVRVREFLEVSGVRCFGFVKPRAKVMLMPFATWASAFTRVWVCAATIEAPCAATFEQPARATRNPCSTWAYAIDTVTESEPMLAWPHIGSVVQRVLVTGARGRHSEHLKRVRRDERVNNRLKQTARGRLGAESLRRT